jgi:hypothetical protein
MPDLTRDLLTAITLALSCRDPAIGMTILEDAVDLAIRNAERTPALPQGFVTAWREERSRRSPPPERSFNDWFEYLNTGR